MRHHTRWPEAAVYWFLAMALGFLLAFGWVMVGWLDKANATTIGASTPTSLTKSDSKYGHVDVVRKFWNGAPNGWPIQRSQVVSFKYQPSAVLSGKYDGALRHWFATAPKVRVWWSYWHEPEDNFRTTAAKTQYKKAWAHIATIANRYGPASLRATYIGTLYSARNGTWSSFYPGNKVIDVIGWDGKVHPSNGRYTSAKGVYGPALRISRAHNKPWGIAEWGSVVINGDYAGRAQWLTQSAGWMRRHNAAFGCWWDSKGANGDFRLLDTPSIRAMRKAMA